jgi:hypothetical protein
MSNEIEEPTWTPIQRKIIELLDDGQSHSPKEIQKLMMPSSIASVSDHIAAIRIKLRPLGQTVIAEYWKRQCFYRRVILYGTSSSVFNSKEHSDTLQNA